MSLTSVVNSMASRAEAVKVLAEEFISMFMRDFMPVLLRPLIPEEMYLACAKLYGAKGKSPQTKGNGTPVYKALGFSSLDKWLAAQVGVDVTGKALRKNKQIACLRNKIEYIVQRSDWAQVHGTARVPKGKGKGKGKGFTTDQVMTTLTAWHGQGPSSADLVKVYDLVAGFAAEAEKTAQEQERTGTNG